MPARWPKEPPCGTKPVTCVSVRALWRGALPEIIAVLWFGESWTEEGGGRDPALNFGRRGFFPASATRARPQVPHLTFRSLNDLVYRVGACTA